MLPLSEDVASFISGKTKICGIYVNTLNYNDFIEGNYLFSLIFFNTHDRSADQQHTRSILLIIFGLVFAVFPIGAHRNVHVRAKALPP
jgi:uncharacterized membrane protein